MGNTLLNKYSFLRSIEFSKRHNSLLELAHAIVLQIGKHTYTEYSAYHHEDSQVRLTQKML